MKHFFVFSFVTLITFTLSIPSVAGDDYIYEHGFEDPKPASALTASVIPMAQDETAAQRGSEVTDNGINTATVGFSNKFGLLLKDEDGHTIPHENPQDVISCTLKSVGPNAAASSDEVACSGSWLPIDGSSFEQLVFSYNPIRSTDLDNGTEWQLEVIINGQALIAAPRTVVYAGLVDYNQSTVEVLSGADGDVAVAGDWITVRLTGYDVQGNRRVFENDGNKTFTANVTNAGGGGNGVVNTESQFQSSFTSFFDMSYEGEGQYQLRFYPYLSTGSLQIAYNVGGVTQDFVVVAGDPAPTSRLRSDGETSAHLAICGSFNGCVAGKDTHFTLDSRDAFGANHDPSADLACPTFSPGCSGTGAGNIRGSAEGDGADYSVSLNRLGAPTDSVISFVGGADPDFFTYSFKPSLAVTDYSLVVTTHTGSNIRGGCNFSDCLTNADDTTTLSAFTPLEVVAGLTYPEYLRETYSPGTFPNTACIPSQTSTLSLRPTDILRNPLSNPTPFETAQYSADVTEGAFVTTYSGNDVSSNADVIEISYMCPNVVDGSPYTIDVHYAGNQEYPGPHTFQLQGVALQSQNVYAFLSPVQESGLPPSGDPAGGPTSSWDLQTVAAGELVNWTLSEYTNANYDVLMGGSGNFSVTLEATYNPGTFLSPAPLVQPTAVAGEYEVSFTPEHTGLYTIRIFKNSILPAEISDTGAGFSAEITAGSLSGPSSFVTGLPTADVLAGEEGSFLVYLRDAFGNELSGPNYEISATYTGLTAGTGIVHSGVINTLDCSVSGQQFRCDYDITVAADFIFTVRAYEIGKPTELVGKSATEGYPQTILAGPASPALSSVAHPVPEFTEGITNSLYIVSRDEYGNRASFNSANQGVDAFVLMLELNPDIAPVASYVGNGVSRWTFTALVGKTSETVPTCPSSQRCPNALDIELGGVPIGGSPFQLTVLPSRQ